MMPMLTVKQVAEELVVSTAQVLRLIARGHIKGIHLGKRSIRIDPQELERFKKDGVPVRKKAILKDEAKRPASRASRSKETGRAWE